MKSIRSSVPSDIFRNAVAIFTLLLGWVLQLPAQECDCIQPPDITTAYNQSDAVIWGTLADATTNWMSGGGKLTFQVEWCWKKGVEKYLPVNTPADPACAYPFDGGRYYLVFLNKKFSWKTSRCSGNIELTDLQTARQLLGEGMAPGIDESRTRQAGTFLIWSTAAGMVLVLIIVLRRKIFRGSGNKS